MNALQFVTVTEGRRGIESALGCHREGMVGTVGKISAFRPQGTQFGPGFAEIWVFVRPSFRQSKLSFPSFRGR